MSNLWKPPRNLLIDFFIFCCLLLLLLYVSINCFLGERKWMIINKPNLVPLSNKSLFSFLARLLWRRWFSCLLFAAVFRSINEATVDERNRLAKKMFHQFFLFLMWERWAKNCFSILSLPSLPSVCPVARPNMKRKRLINF